MFVSELELFSIATINLPLKALEIVVVSTIQTKKKTTTTDVKANPSCNFKSSTEITFDNNPRSIQKIRCILKHIITTPWVKCKLLKHQQKFEYRNYRL
jgi:hypothetical protein